MVARIRTGKQINSALLYNEHKVEMNKASLLGGYNCVIDPSQMNRHEKLNLFKKYTSLNQQTKVNALHISLNFDKSDCLTNEKLLCIAEDYMNGIGFSEQPCFIYKHTDAAHPHIHIVSTNIRRDGSRISLHNIGRNQSEVARVAIETEFGLKKAAGSGEQQLSPMVPVRAMKVRYGVQATKQAISDTLSFVLSEYKFCSLPELNAILRLYNVTAEGGTKDSILYKNGGLLYFVTNENGKPVSAPVKASQFSMKPTLKNLRSLFLRNEQLREPHKKQLIVILNLALHNSRNKDLSQLADSLKNYRVTLLPRTNSGGIDYGITYIDHRSRCVFNEGDLGKAWSAKAVCDYLSAKHSSPDRRGSYEEAKYLSTELSSGYKKSILTDNSHLQIPPLVPEAELSKESVPFPLHIKKRSRKRKQLKI